MLEMIKRKAGLNVLYYRLKNSIEEIEAKHPERNDLLKPMRESLSEVAESIQYFTHCENVTRATNSRNHDLELENIKLKQENKSLNKHLEMLISGEI
jgi:predicted RNase H-like nuclease (RuvC/YqgF family)